MSKVRTITLWQPWASLMAIEAKKFETRHWATAYRGPLAIHAAKTKKGRASCHRLITNTLTHAGYATFDHLPFGCVLALMNLKDIYSTDTLMKPRPISPMSMARFVTEKEIAFGDWSDGRYAWEMEMVHRYDPPIPARGYQGFWWWEPPTIEERVDMIMSGGGERS